MALRGKPAATPTHHTSFDPMKKRFIIFHAVPAGLFVGLVFGMVASRGVVNAQGPIIAKTGDSRPARVVATRENKATIERFAGAATQNAQLETTLSWTFSGKTQTGWQIYEPLIAQTIETDSSAVSAEFAAALAKWQTGHGLEGTGILDESTLNALRSFWQSQRLGRSDFPGDDKLITAPIADFYDPTRSPDLLQLERETYIAYKRMISAAAKDLSREMRFTKDGNLATGEKFLKIVSAFRSQDYQDKLRQQSPGSGRGTLALHSAHNTGQALDLYVGGEPVSTKDANRLVQTQTAAYKWLVKNAGKFGFVNYYYEPWHWEYVGARSTSKN
jgi:D-alanyl-D-alanine carboxypeptidase